MTAPSQGTEQKMTQERLHSLYELIGRLNSVYELPELLEFVVDRALNLTGGRRGLLLLDDDHKPELQHIAVARGEKLADQDLEQTLAFVSTTVIKDVLAQGEPRLVVDLPLDQRYEGLTSQSTFRFKRVRSVLAVPLNVDAQPVGLIYIDHPRRNVFGPSDLDFLSAFATQATLAINRARQHQQQIDELTRLNELSRAVVQVLDLDEVLTRIVYEAIRMLQVETGSVLLLNEETNLLTFNVSVSEGRRAQIETSLELGEGLAGYAAQTGEVICVSDVSQDERWFGEVDIHFSTRSILCVPLQTNDGRILGVLQVLNKKGDQGFGASDVTRLSAFAASATIAIENAHLFQEATEARRLRALNEVALKLGSSLDLETILNAGLQETLKILAAEAGVISLINDQTQTDMMPLRGSQGLSSDPDVAQAQAKALGQLLSLVLGNEITEMLIIDQQCSQGHAQWEIIQTGGIRALALVPIQIRNEMQGTLAVMYSTPHLYTEEELSLLTGIARIVGLAIQNAIHYREMQAKAMQLTYMNEIGTALTGSLEVWQVLNVFTESANTLLKTERASVFLIDETSNELVLQYSDPEGTNIRLTEPWAGIVGWAALQDQPVLVNDATNDPRFAHKIAQEIGFKVHSLLCVPLKIEGKVIGVVEVLNKLDGLFTNDHLSLLIELSHWATIAIQTARLYEGRIQEQKRRVEAETRIAMADLILNMAHTMNNIVGAIRVWGADLTATVQKSPEVPIAQFQHKLQRIRDNAQEAIGLISNIRGPLEVGKNGNLGPTDVQRCLDNAIESCWWPEGVSYHCALGADLPPVWASAEGLEAVFHNLLSNAIQALTPTGGEVQISTTCTAPHRVEIIIADNGPGIPQPLQDRIFQPGISSRKDKLGFGLWLVETFVRRFEGQIQFTSHPTTGTAFHLTLKTLVLEDKDLEDKPLDGPPLPE